VFRRRRAKFLLAPHGKAEEYPDSLGTDRSNEVAIEAFGKERLTKILRDVADYVKTGVEGRDRRERQSEVMAVALPAVTQESGDHHTMGVLSLLVTSPRTSRAESISRIVTACRNH